MDVIRSSHSRTLLSLITLSSTLFSLPALAQNINAVMRLQGRVSMDSLAKSVVDPSSPRFGLFYTPEEIRDLAAPSPREYERTLIRLRQEGFQVTAESPTRLWVSVQADSKVFEQVFNTQIRLTAQGQRLGLAVTSNPSRLPGVAAVVGLDNSRKAHPLLRQSTNTRGKKHVHEIVVIDDGEGMNRERHHTSSSRTASHSGITDLIGLMALSAISF
jgi:subtilase family serine protease